MVELSVLSQVPAAAANRSVVEEDRDQTPTVMIWRRVVLLHNACAKVCPMARSWGVLVVGKVGRYYYRVLEPYDLWQEATDRATTINRAGQAIVMSIEEVIFPNGYPVVRYLPKDIPIDGRIPGITIPTDSTQEEHKKFYANKSDLQILKD